MPRALTSAAAAAITTNQGEEPHIVLMISYASSGTAILKYYATKDLTIGSVSCEGAIINVGRVSTQLKKTSSATVSTVNVTISDTLGSIKNLMDLAIFEKVNATLYLYYVGFSLSDMIILTGGNVIGPVSWNETTRIANFGIESPIQNKDLGFAPTVEDFSDLDPEAQGITWPMIFGMCAHVPAVKIHSRAIGALKYPIRFYTAVPYAIVSGFFQITTNPSIICYNTASGTPNVIFIDRLDLFPATTTSIIVDNVIFQGTIYNASSGQFNVTTTNLPKYTNVTFGARVTGDADVNNYAVGWMPDDNHNIANCYLEMTPVTTTRPWSNYCVQQIGRKCWFQFPMQTKLGSGYVSNIDVNPSYSIAFVYPIPKNGMLEDFEMEIDTIRNAVINRKQPSSATSPYGSIISTINTQVGNAAAWWSAPSDTQVLAYTSTDADVYVASLVQLSSVQAVYGKRRIKDSAGKSAQVFQPLPTTYYTIQLTSSYAVVGQYASAIIVSPPLATYKDQDWEDTIYVTATSTIGPNPADEIKFIANNFTTLSCNTATFNAVHDNLRDANFALFEKREALTVIEEIAWQARLGIILEDNTISLNFLAGNSGAVLAMSDVNIDIQDGYTQTQTPLTALTTKMLATYTDTYKERHEPTVKYNQRIREVEHIVRSLKPDPRRSKSETLYYLYQNNTIKYGTRMKSVVVYIFNEPSPVKEVIDFWGYRESNVWRKAKIKGFPDALKLQPFDIISILLTDTSIVGSSVLLSALVTGTDFDYHDMSVTLDVEYPVLAGGFSDVSSTYWPGNTYTTGATVVSLIWNVNETS